MSAGLGRRLALASLCLLQFATARAADDTVYLIGDDPRGQAKLVGQVQDYTTKELRLKLAGGKERIVPANKVARVTTAICDEQQAGDELLAHRDAKAALAKYSSALEGQKEPRLWMRRRIAAQLVWCYQALGQSADAGETFLAILESDPETIYFGCIPLCWTHASTTPATEKQAQAWMARPESASVLLGASYLLGGAQRAAGLKALQRLTADADPRVALLATAQLWRTETEPLEIETLAQRQRVIDKLPAPLRGGPAYVLGLQAAPVDPQRAAISLLRVPIVHADDIPLSSAALLAAGDALEKSNRAAAAALVYRELVRDFPHARERGEAEKRLAALGKTGAS